MKRFFFSLRASYLFFALLAMMFGAGNRLAAVDEYNILFRKITATHLIRCLEEIIRHPILLAWFAVFLLIGAGLFINTACCTVSQMGVLARLRQTGRDKSGKVMQMALIHIAALVVVGLHIIEAALIQRHQPVRIYPGETVILGGFEVTVLDISYVTDRGIITEDETGRKMKSSRIPARSFSVEKNYAQIQIVKNGSPTEVRELRMFAPVRVGMGFFFLDGFVIAHGSDDIGIEIHHGFNPLAFIFFGMYIVLFGLLLVRYFTYGYSK